jgi:RNA polymerase sigma-70 factor (ECF subfamily)
MALTDLFLPHLPGGAASDDQDQELEEVLELLVRRGRERWPNIEHDPARLLADLARAVPKGAAPAEHLRRLAGSDLYLASACIHGVSGAIERFEAAFFSEVDAALIDARVPREQIEEVKQILRERFFVVGTSDRLPAIAEYSGRGSLRAWTRVSAMREVYRITDAQKRWARLEEDKLALMASPEDDPELRYLKRQYRADFKEAAVEAMGRLTPRQRNLLRHSILDRMSIDQIGRLYRVHRATAARWLAQARETVLSHTRELLSARLELESEEEFDDLFQLIESRLDVSLRSLLVSRRA